MIYCVLNNCFKVEEEGIILYFIFYFLAAKRVQEVALSRTFKELLGTTAINKVRDALSAVPCHGPWDNIRY